MKLKSTLLGALALACAMPMAAQDYPVRFGEDSNNGHGSRVYNGFTFNSSFFGDQTISSNGRAMYQPNLSTALKAYVGDIMDVTTDYSGEWMHAYVYLDRGNDGQFDIATSVSGSELKKGDDDVLAFSFLAQGTAAPYDEQGCDSNGKVLTGSARSTRDIPEFTFPEGTTPGAYRMRVKIDWSHIDPAGDADIRSNGGVIVDAMLHIVGDNTKVLAPEVVGGVVDGIGTFAQGNATTVTVTPNEGFTLKSLTIKYGFNVMGEAEVHGNPQYTTVEVQPAEDGTYTIPAEYMLGEVLVAPVFENCTSGVDAIEIAEQGGAIYDLMGRKVVNPTSGLYIQNGRKVVIRK